MLFLYFIMQYDDRNHVLYCITDVSIWVQLVSGETLLQEKTFTVVGVTQTQVLADSIVIAASALNHNTVAW